MRPDCRA